MVTRKYEVIVEPNLTITRYQDGFYFAFERKGQPLLYADKLTMGEVIDALVNIFLLYEVPGYLKTTEEWIAGKKSMKPTKVNDSLL